MSSINNDMDDWIRKRRHTFISFCILACCLGTEYSIIIPSLWFYINDVIKVKDAKSFYGTILAVYYISAIIGSFTITWVADRTRRTRMIMMILSICELVGNILYSIPISPYCPLIGRFIQGLGDVNMSIMTAEIARSYPSTETGSKISIIVTCFSITFVIAPAMNVLFKYIDVEVVGFRINYGNLPGLFMVLLFTVVFLVVYFFVSDLSREYDLKEMTNGQNNTGVAGSKCLETGIAASTCLETGVAATTFSEKTPILQCSNPTVSYKKGSGNEPSYVIVGRWVGDFFQVDENHSGQRNPDQSGGRVSQYSTLNERVVINSFSRDDTNTLKAQLLTNIDFILLIMIGFLMSFSIVAFLDVTTPIYGNEYYNFSSRDTGILFFVTGILFIFVVNVTKRLSDRILEHTFLLIGFGIFIVSTSLLLVVSLLKQSNYYLGVVLFVMYVLLLGVCWCIEQVFIRSLLTKIVCSSYQAFAEGVRRSMSSVACIVASVGVPYILKDLKYLCVGVMVLSVVAMIALHLRRTTLRQPAHR